MYYCIYFLWLNPDRAGEAAVAFADGCLLFRNCCFWVLINATLTTSVTYTSAQRSDLTRREGETECPLHAPKRLLGGKVILSVWVFSLVTHAGAIRSKSFARTLQLPFITVLQNMYRNDLYIHPLNETITDPCGFVSRAWWFPSGDVDSHGRASCFFGGTARLADPEIRRLSRKSFLFLNLGSGNPFRGLPPGLRNWGTTGHPGTSNLCGITGPYATQGCYCWIYIPAVWVV